MALTTRQLCITQWILVAHEKHFFLSNNHKPVKIVELRSRILEELPTVPSWLSKIKKGELDLTDGLTLHTKLLQGAAFQERVVKLIQH